MIDSHRDEIAKLESLYASNPEGRVFTHLAEACRKAGQHERAREILEDGLRRHPDYASAHVVLGRVLLDTGDTTNAMSEFRRVLELDRHNLVALRSLGDLAASSGNTDEALHYYDELSVLDPSDGGIQEELRKLRKGQISSAAAEAAPVATAEDEKAAPAIEPLAGNTTGLETTPPAVDLTLEPEAGESIAVEGFEASGTHWGRTAEAAEPPAAGAEERNQPVADTPLAESGEPVDFTPAPEQFAVVEPVSAAIEGGDAIEAAEAASASVEASQPAGEAGAETPAAEDETTPPVEGRWTEPETIQADIEAERGSPKGDTGEWIPADRWEWMTASADTHEAPAEHATDEARAEAEEPEQELEAAEPAAPDWLQAVGICTRRRSSRSRRSLTSRSPPTKRSSWLAAPPRPSSTNRHWPRRPPNSPSMSR